MNKFIATENDAGRTLIKFLEKVLNDVPKSKIERIFRNKDVLLNGQRTKEKKTIVKIDDEIIVYGVRFANKTYTKTAVKFEVIFEDQNILVINKPIGYEVHGNSKSIDNQVISYLNFERIDSFEPSHIGRLDKITSGVMLYAKNYNSLRLLKENQDKFKKIYRCVSDLDKSIILEAKIYHDENLLKEVVNKEYGKDIKAIFKPIENNELEVELITGRKHQIRASLEFLGHPIKGDVKYGGEKAKRVYLHSYELTIDGLEGDLEYLNGKSFITGPYF